LDVLTYIIENTIEISARSALNFTVALSMLYLFLGSMVKPIVGCGSEEVDSNFANTIVFQSQARHCSNLFLSITNENALHEMIKELNEKCHTSE